MHVQQAKGSESKKYVDTTLPIGMCMCAHLSLSLSLLCVMCLQPIHLFYFIHLHSLLSSLSLSPPIMFTCARRRLLSHACTYAHTRSLPRLHLPCWHASSHISSLSSHVQSPLIASTSASASFATAAATAAATQPVSSSASRAVAPRTNPYVPIFNNTHLCIYLYKHVYVYTNSISLLLCFFFLFPC